MLIPISLAQRCEEGTANTRKPSTWTADAQCYRERDNIALKWQYVKITTSYKNTRGSKSLVKITGGHQKERPLLSTMRTRSTAFLAPNFFMICRRWISTVRRLIPRFLAASLLEAAATTWFSTSRSRCVRRPQGAKDWDKGSPLDSRFRPGLQHSIV